MPPIASDNACVFLRPIFYYCRQTQSISGRNKIVYSKNNSRPCLCLAVHFRTFIIDRIIRKICVEIESVVNTYIIPKSANQSKKLEPVLTVLLLHRHFCKILMNIDFSPEMSNLHFAMIFFVFGRHILFIAFDDRRP